MLSLALRGMRTRWVTFVGSFVALALGVGLIATTGLALAATFDAPERGTERFAEARVVVQGTDEVKADTPIGVRTSTLTNPRAVPEKLAAELATVGPVAEDRTFPVSVPDADRRIGADTTLVGHSWAIAAATPYRLTSGRAPTSPGEVVGAQRAGCRAAGGPRQVGVPAVDAGRLAVRLPR
ncbi:ABC transporter permease, partial [Streptomyces coeruleorubidus]